MSEWDDLNAQFVVTLRETRTEPVPEEIVKVAQRSLDGTVHPSDPSVVLHAMQHTFPTEAKAAAFARLIKSAGAHTVPPSTVTVVIDPARGKVQAVAEDGTLVFTDDGRAVMVPGPPVNPCTVAWRAGKKRGRVAG